MKQMAMLLSAGLMAFVLSACGEDQPKQPDVKPAENATTKPMNMNDAQAAPEAETPESTGTATEE